MSFLISETNLSGDDVSTRCSSEPFMNSAQFSRKIGSAYVASLRSEGYTVFCLDETANYCSKNGGVSFDRVTQPNDEANFWSLESDDMTYSKFDSQFGLSGLARVCGFDSGAELLEYVSMEYSELVGRYFTFYGQRVRVEFL